MASWWRHPGNNAPERDQRILAFPSLLDRARSGEAEAISALYRQFLPGIYWYIAARVPDRGIAEDLTSEVFLEMVEDISKVRANGEAMFASWLFQIARVTVAGYYRKHEHVPASVSLEAASSWEDDSNITIATVNYPEADPVKWAEVRDEWHAVAQAINALTEEQRQVLVGRLILGYDVTTVAQMVGKKANAIKALQFRALNSLRRFLQKRNPSEEMFHRHDQHQEDVR